MKIISTAVVAAVVAIPGLAFAGEYGMAGCGLGAVVLGADGGQVSAATTNGSFGSQTLGITTGTSECTDSAESAALDQKAFIQHNYAKVSREAAQGQGEYLSAFATILGCEAQAHPSFFEMTKEQHGELFNAEQKPGAVLQKVKDAARKDAQLRNACARI